MGTFSTEDSFLGLPGTTASNIWDEEIGLRRRRASIWLFFLSLLKIWINQKSFWLVNICYLQETVIFRGSRAMAGIAGVVLLCYRTFVVISRTVYISTSSLKLVMLLQTFHLHWLYFYSSPFFSIRISSLVTVMDFIIYHY